jgi:hypothetical protein
MPAGADGVIPLSLGDVVRLRKPHACGENRWEVVRLGADIGLRCLQCAHRILLARSELERRLASFVERGAPPELGLGGPEGD